MKEICKHLLKNNQKKWMTQIIILAMEIVLKSNKKIKILNIFKKFDKN